MTGSVIMFPLVAFLSILSGDDWLQWRGPNGNATVDSQKPPVKWGAVENILWRTRIPGRGHSSPVVVNSCIYLTTADENQQIQSVLCFDRSTGKLIWNSVVHRGGFVKKIHAKNTHASPTIASNGKSLFVCFNREESVFLTKLDLDGKIVWQENTGRFVPKYPFGFAASPTIWKNLVIVAGESEKSGFLCAYDTSTGKEVWRIHRKATNYSSPIVAKFPDRFQLLLSGGSTVSGFDPVNGEMLWSAPASWQVSCGTLVWDQQRVFASGGFPRGQTLCIKADGSGEVLWQNRVKCYEQSLLYHDSFVYGISDAGIGYCWNSDNGKEIWKQRLEGPVSSSPILANGNIYCTSERGNTFVFRANSNRFELVARNKLGDSCFATPAICSDQILMRIGSDENGRRQEYLICIGEKK